MNFRFNPTLVAGMALTAVRPLALACSFCLATGLFAGTDREEAVEVVSMTNFFDGDSAIEG